LRDHLCSRLAEDTFQGWKEVERGVEDAVGVGFVL